MNDLIDEEAVDKPFGDLVALAPDMPVSAAHGIGALALNFALKYWDLNMVKDGALYQQYKLEGRNLPGLHLEMVFEVAAQIERHILATPNRLSEEVIGTILDGIGEDLATDCDALGEDSEQAPA